MGDILSQEEIDALFAKAAEEQEKTQGLTAEEQAKIDALSNQLYNQNVDFIKNMVSEEQNKEDEIISEKIEALSNQLYNQNTDFIKSMVDEEQKKNNEMISEQEKQYMSTIYYKNLQSLIINIDQYATSLVQNVMYSAMQSQRFNKKEFTCNFIINSIGFPVPDRFLNQLKLVLKNKLEELIQIDGWEQLDVEIKPIDYTNTFSLSSSLYKKTNFYTIEVSMKKLKKDINITKK